jgi:acyl-[acyl-carrier-protein]-phospholipid O-acyltransferase/long-chain-fatty-acid--[acyl-carrier-protein] ligase
VEGLNVPLVPVHLDRVWGSVFSFERKSFIWKLPRQLPYPVTISFGRPLARPRRRPTRSATPSSNLGAAAFEHRLDALKALLHQHFYRQARRQWTLALPVRHDGPAALSYGKLATGALLLSRRLRGLLPPEKNVGVLLPPGGRGGRGEPGPAVRRAGAGEPQLFPGPGGGRPNLPGRRDHGAAHGPENGGGREMGGRRPGWSSWRICLAPPNPRPWRRSWRSAFCPRGGSSAWWRPVFRRKIGVDDLAALLFTSGSTGTPKGVMLTHRNIHANIQGLQETFQLTGATPCSGSCRFSIPSVSPAPCGCPCLSGCRVAYHRSPAGARGHPQMIKDEEGVTIFIATPTFLQMWFKKLDRDDVKRLRFALTGAEKLSTNLRP